MDPIKIERDLEEEGQSKRSRDQYWQSEENHEDQLRPFTLVLLKTGVQDSVEDVKIELDTDDAAVKIDPLSNVRMKFDEDALNLDIKDTVEDIKIEPGSDEEAELMFKTDDIQLNTEEDESGDQHKAVGFKRKDLHSLDNPNESHTDLHNPNLYQGTEKSGYQHLCKVCKKSFSTSSCLKNHLCTHIGKCPTLCKVCNGSVTELNARYERIRSEGHPYVCNVCESSFSRRGVLKNHLRVHTGERPYSCDVCKKAFTHRHILKSHMYTHTGERPYSCDVCKKAFSQLGILKRHHRVHANECTYSCDVCKKSFSLQSNLTIHMIMHTTERPYSCNVCKKSFSQLSNLKNHQRVHTAERPYIFSTQ